MENRLTNYIPYLTLMMQILNKDKSGCEQVTIKFTTRTVRKAIKRLLLELLDHPHFFLTTCRKMLGIFKKNYLVLF